MWINELFILLNTIWIIISWGLFDIGIIRYLQVCTDICTFLFKPSCLYKSDIHFHGQCD